MLAGRYWKETPEYSVIAHTDMLVFCGERLQHAEAQSRLDWKLKIPLATCRRDSFRGPARLTGGK